MADFDFYGQFSAQSTAVLINIVREPDQYQPEAMVMWLTA